ncbi:TonB-dependent receptor domain-containing protein [Ferruginibacter sp.]|nr:TonB-dependent receptor [Ferruginibacter sp.]
MINKLHKKIIVLFSCLFIIITAQAQNFLIKGIVTTSDGKPAARVNIQLTETNQTIITAADGSYQFTKLYPGKYNLVVSYTGLATQVKHFTVTKESTEQTIDFVLLENYTELAEIIIGAAKTKLDRIATIGKLPIKPMDLPQATAVIERQVIERQQVQTLGDAVQNLNGVYVMGNTGGYQEELGSRGFAFNSNNTFKNGVRFNNSIMPEVSGLESIEVLKGGNAILFGTVGAGGVLNIVTKKPLFVNGGSVSFQTGSYDYYKPAIDIYGAISNSKHFAYRINSSFTKAGSFRDNVKSQRYYVNPSLLIKMGAKTEVLLEADYTQDNRNLDFGTGAIYYKLANTPRYLYLNLPWSYNNSEQIAATSTITHNLTDKWQIKSVYSTRKYNNDLFGAARPNTNSQFIDSSAANYGRWIRGLVKNKNIERYNFASVDVTGKFITGKIQHTLLAGIDADITKTTAYNFDLTQYRTDKKNIYDTVNIFGTKQYTQRNDVPNVPWLLYTNTTMRRLGIYVQDFVEVSPKIKMLGGIRYSVSKTETPDSIYASNNNKLHNEKRTNDAFSPRLGFVYQPSKNISLFTSYTNTYELNTAIDTFGRVLPPSIIDQFEMGVKTMLLNNSISVNVIAYVINNNNAVQSYPNLSPGDSRRENGGQTQSKGAELDIVTKNIHGFNINAGYSYNDIRYKKSTLYVPGSRILYTPNHTANAHIYYVVKPSNKLNGLGGGIGLYYVGERVAGRSTTKANPGYALMPVPDYFLFEASIGYTYRDVRFRFKVNNIFNQLSYNVHDDNSINPIAPRQFTATVSYKF